MGLTSLLASDGYLVVNKTLIRELGLETATVFSILCNEHDYWERENRLHYGMFYITIAKLEEYTGLSYHKQSRVLKTLEEKELISITVEGMPATRYIRINEDAVFKLFEISFQKIHNQFSKNLNQDNNINNNKENNNKSFSKENEEFEIPKTHTNDVLDKLKKDISGSDNSNLDPKLDLDNFIGSANKIEKKKGKNRFEQCIDVIDEFTDDQIVKTKLISYLRMLFEGGTYRSNNGTHIGKHFEGRQLYVNQWRGLLTKLMTLVSQGNEINAVIEQSLERGYKSFYPINMKFKCNNDYDNNQSYIDEVNANNDEQEQSDRIY